MQVVFESYDAARAACDKVNHNRERPLSVYRVFNEEGKQRFVVSLSPKEARGEAAEFFGIEAEKWPRKKAQKLKGIVKDLSEEEKEELRRLLEEGQEE
jgi:hypothetical protein